MSRRTVFAGIAAGALALAVIAGGGVAFAVVQGQNSLDDFGPATVEASVPSASPTVTPTPGEAAPPGSLAITERLRPWRDGDQVVTEQEFRDFHAMGRSAGIAPDSWEKVLKENLYAVACMKTAGFFWDPRYDARYGADANLTHADSGARIALYGEPQGDNYDWRLGGCDGVGSHISGTDGGPGVPDATIPGYGPTG